MINAFYSAKSGTKNYQYYLDTVANNISNVNTQGFKAQSVTFTDLMYTDFENAEGTTLQNGNGSRVLLSRDMTQGPAERSDDTADVMINGAGFFAVQDSAGDIAYTRSGSLSTSEIDGVSYLVTENGDFVLDQNLNKIEIDVANPVTFLSPGDAAGLTDTDKLNKITVGLFSFYDSEQLIATGDGKYVIAENSTLTPKLDTDSSIVSSMLESSNVSLVVEMAKMITAQRGFQINSTMIQTVDEMEQYANNLAN